MYCCHFDHDAYGWYDPQRIRLVKRAINPSHTQSTIIYCFCYRQNDMVTLFANSKKHICTHLFVLYEVF